MGGRAKIVNVREKMNKKAVFGTAAVVLVAGYGAATWYMGERAHSAYQQAMEEMRKVVSPEVLVSESYTQGFWSSQGQLVLQWAPPVVKEDGEERPAGAAQAVAPPPIRVTVQNTVRHGPLAGWRLAAAVVETQVTAVEGLDASVREAFAKVSTPTLTTVRNFTGSHNITLAWPAGELGDGQELVRWQPLVYRMNLNADHSRMSGDFAWPEITMNLQPQREEDDDAPAAPESQGKRVDVAMQGMTGDFNLQLEDGLWLLAPGTGKGKFDKVTVTRAAPGAAAGAAPEPLMALQDLSYDITIARTGAHLGWVTSARGKGSVGPVEMQSLELKETVSRIDVEALKLVQKALFDAYKADPNAQRSPDQAPSSALLMEAASKFMAALPAYAMKLSAQVDGEQGELEYGAELKTVPDAQKIAQGAWAPALLKSSVVHASVRLPKAWLPRLVQATSQKAPRPEDIDAMLTMAESQGFLKQEASQVTSVVRMQEGKVVLNGKEINVPFAQH